MGIGDGIGRITSWLGDRGRGRADRDARDWQAEIDRIDWYHEFDFGNGLHAQSRIENLEGVRQIWRFIETHLDRLDFTGKSVLDVGAWDGFWSFYAERRGAASVLATDDRSQNWARGTGLSLARELLGSNVEVQQQVPIYELASLNRRFDLILCLGVFYHLRDPFYGFTQLRHCCHANTIVAIEGELAWSGVTRNEVRYFYNNWLEFLPTESALTALLRSAYFEIDSPVWLHEHPPSGSGSAPADVQTDRAFFICRPFVGANEMYVYKPHFGLHVHDPRFSGSSAT
jgi:tRNA (mo5U34)-methyltransferase